MNNLKSFIIKGAFAAILLSGVVASADAVSAASIDMGNDFGNDTTIQMKPINELLREGAEDANEYEPFL